MKILSLSSAVAFGHVGNSAIGFPLQRLGFEVWPVDSVQFSNHPGYGGFGGAVNDVRPVLDGLGKLGVLDRCDGVLTGYLGDAANGAAALEAVARVRAAHPGALVLCDPVMGDAGRLYVRPGIPELMRDALVPAADVVTPNLFELEQLAGPGEPVPAARRLLARGPKLVVVTSAGDGATCLAVTADAAWAVRTPLVPLDPPANGAGDLLAALLLAHVLRGRPAPEALSLAVSSLYGVLQATHRQGRRELALVAAQEELVTPSVLFAAEAVL